MCFVWLSKQTAIISMYSIKWLVFTTETECVYCAVWTGSLNIIQLKVHIIPMLIGSTQWRYVLEQHCYLDVTDQRHWIFKYDLGYIRFLKRSLKYLPVWPMKISPSVSGKTLNVFLGYIYTVYLWPQWVNAKGDNILGWGAQR